MIAAYTYDGIQSDYVLARYNCDGSLDSSFSDDGIVTTDISDNEGSTYLVLQPDGKIVVTGYVWDGNDHDWVVLRYEGGVSPNLTISPPSGKYVTTQEFDLALIAEAPGLSLVGGSATLDGADVTSILVQNVIPGTLVTGGMTFRLPGIEANLFSPGCHMLSVELDLSDGTSIGDAITWEVRENTEP